MRAHFRRAYIRAVFVLRCLQLMCRPIAKKIRLLVWTGQPNSDRVFHQGGKSEVNVTLLLGAEEEKERPGSSIPFRKNY